ncbi:MAG: MarR family transcriptional regulator [Bacteroidetes bacterium]|nr:MarR family transcriptional regulator [Bacteroidota bacterium]
MRLEDEIQQKKFKSIQQKLMLNLIYTTNWLTSKQDSLFKDSDITVQQYNVLRILRGQYPNPCSIKLIKERMLDRMSDTSRIVDKLYTKKLLERNECPDDRRSVNVVISDKGLELLKSLDYVDDLSKQSLKSLTTAEINTLNELLDKLRD